MKMRPDLQLVMQYLYCGGCNNLDVSANDVLELMAAASFFQLEGLLRYTEARCAEIIDIDNVVAMYIHAKVCGLNLDFRINCNSPNAHRCTTLQSLWNIARDFCFRTWSHSSHTMTL